ncbi:PIN domain-containing protein [Parapedobacter sp. 2B3]|uniref:PIN domain-containing protein n=1 Tax=Parapedobacter sp. 2B3 TaxID=3342381 RepID=UPI0035B68EC1
MAIPYTKLTKFQLIQIEQIILANLTLVSEELISEQSWVTAYELTKDVDEDDTPLAKGLQEKGANLIISTAQMKAILK